MLAPLKWIKDYVDIDIPVKEYAEKMIMSGSMVESIEESGKEITNVVVGKIIKHEKHPDADTLSINQVDVGSEVVQIVTAAQNVKEGDYIPVAVVGATLPNDVKIKKGKLRGVVSCGMMCSAGELNMSLEGLPDEQVHGIYILDKEYPLGADIKEVLGLNKPVIEFEITNNRPDCLSILGIARETAATLKKEIRLPETNFTEKSSNEIENLLNVEVKASDLCKRYTARIVKNVVIKPSPMWMQEYLQDAGVRPINNIVDITNFIMIELGQPLHAFDYRMIANKKIIVRRANEGEKITTLDEKDYTLTSDNLLIADNEKGIAIAGVMGGLNSEIKDDTTMVVFEFANFDAVATRLTSKKLGVRTDASSKFEKGIDSELTWFSMLRTMHLVEQLGAGEIVGGIIDVYAEPKQKRTISVKREKINAILGMDISADEIKGYLKSVYLEVVGDDDMEITIPTYRDDITCSADIAEEVARLYGYDRIPSKIMNSDFTAGGKTFTQQMIDEAKRVMVSQGYFETCMYSFVSPTVFDKINLANDNILRQAITIINPLGEDQSIMRTTMIPNMLDVLSKNYNKKIDNGKFFEISKVYLPKSLPLTGLANEKETLIMGAYGKNIDVFDLKGALENLLITLKIDKYKIVQGKNDSMHPGRTATIFVDNIEIGSYGEVHPMVLKNYGIDVRAYILEIDFATLLNKARLYNQYKTLPKYPAVSRDIALLVSDEITCGQIEDIIRNKGGKMLEEVILFDVYKGNQIEEGYKSMAYGIVYRDINKTLEENDVAKVHNKILATLENQLGAKLRQ